MIFIVMGVSGCGKSTIGKQLSEKLAIPFFDADDFHPKENIDKMANGFALNDSDRLPWLEVLSLKINKWNADKGAVLACSALKESYRKILSNQVEKIVWIYLEGDAETIQTRLQKRNNHFMDPNLLTSQFNTLEVPNYGIHISIQASVESITNTILEKITNG